MLKSNLLRWSVLTLLLNCSAVAVAQDKSANTTVLPVNNHSAHQAAETLNTTMQGAVSIAADPQANVLVVRGVESDVRQTAELLKSIDKAPGMVTIEVEISVKNPDGKDSRLLDRMKLTALENSSAMLQLGQEVAVPTGITSTRGFSSRTQMVQTQSTGTQLQATAVNGPDGITIDLNLEKSWLEPAKADADSKDIASPSKFILISKSRLRVQDGKSQKIEATGSSGVATREVVIEVTASMASGSRRSTSGRTSASSRSAPNRGPRRSGAVGRGFSRSAQPYDFDLVTERMFGFLDKNDDDKLSAKEIEGAQPMLRSLDLVGAKEVSRDEFFKKMRVRYEKSIRDRERRSSDSQSRSDRGGR